MAPSKPMQSKLARASSRADRYKRGTRAAIEDLVKFHVLEADDVLQLSGHSFGITNDTDHSNSSRRVEFKANFADFPLLTAANLEEIVRDNLVTLRLSANEETLFMVMCVSQMKPFVDWRGAMFDTQSAAYQRMKKDGAKRENLYKSRSVTVVKRCGIAKDGDNAEHLCFLRELFEECARWDRKTGKPGVDLGDLPPITINSCGLLCVWDESKRGARQWYVRPARFGGALAKVTDANVGLGRNGEPTWHGPVEGHSGGGGAREHRADGAGGVPAHKRADAPKVVYAFRDTRRLRGLEDVQTGKDPRQSALDSVGGAAGSFGNASAGRADLGSQGEDSKDHGKRAADDANAMTGNTAGGVLTRPAKKPKLAPTHGPAVGWASAAGAPGASQCQLVPVNSSQSGPPDGMGGGKTGSAQRDASATGRVPMQVANSGPLSGRCQGPAHALASMAGACRASHGDRPKVAVPIKSWPRSVTRMLSGPLQPKAVVPLPATKGPASSHHAGRKVRVTAEGILRGSRGSSPACEAGLGQEAEDGGGRRKRRIGAGREEEEREEEEGGKLRADVDGCNESQGGRKGNGRQHLPTQRLSESLPLVAPGIHPPVEEAAARGADAGGSKSGPGGVVQEQGEAGRSQPAVSPPSVSPLCDIMEDEGCDDDISDSDPHEDAYLEDPGYGDFPATALEDEDVPVDSGDEEDALMATKEEGTSRTHVTSPGMHHTRTPSQGGADQGAYHPRSGPRSAPPSSGTDVSPPGKGSPERGRPQAVRGRVGHSNRYDGPSNGGGTSTKHPRIPTGPSDFCAAMRALPSESVEVTHFRWIGGCTLWGRLEDLLRLRTVANGIDICSNQLDLWPIFMPSRGRAGSAHTRLHADHALGMNTRYLLILVVEPHEAEAYKQLLCAQQLLMVLPRRGRGIGCRMEPCTMLDNFIAMQECMDRNLENVAMIGMSSWRPLTQPQVKEIWPEMRDAFVHKVVLFKTSLCRKLNYDDRNTNAKEDVGVHEQLPATGLHCIKIRDRVWFAKLFHFGGCRDAIMPPRSAAQPIRSNVPGLVPSMAHPAGGGRRCSPELPINADPAIAMAHGPKQQGTSPKGLTFAGSCGAGVSSEGREAGRVAGEGGDSAPEMMPWSRAAFEAFLAGKCLTVRDAKSRKELSSREAEAPASKRARIERTAGEARDELAGVLEEIKGFLHVLPTHVVKEPDVNKVNAAFWDMGRVIGLAEEVLQEEAKRGVMKVGARADGGGGEGAAEDPSGLATMQESRRALLAMLQKNVAKPMAYTFEGLQAPHARKLLDIWLTLLEKLLQTTQEVEASQEPGQRAWVADHMRQWRVSVRRLLHSVLVAEKEEEWGRIRKKVPDIVKTFVSTGIGHQRGHRGAQGSGEPSHMRAGAPLEVGDVTNTKGGCSG
eukprot:jgi/Mesvir1/18639/Mv17145-RA.2